MSSFFASSTMAVHIENATAAWPEGIPPLNGLPFLDKALPKITRKITTIKDTKVICQGERSTLDNKQFKEESVKNLEK